MLKYNEVKFGHFEVIIEGTTTIHKREVTRVEHSEGEDLLVAAACAPLEDVQYRFRRKVEEYRARQAQRLALAQERAKKEKEERAKAAARKTPRKEGPLR